LTPSSHNRAGGKIPEFGTPRSPGSTFFEEASPGAVGGKAACGNAYFSAAHELGAVPGDIDSPLSNAISPNRERQLRQVRYELGSTEIVMGSRSAGSPMSSQGQVFSFADVATDDWKGKMHLGQVSSDGTLYNGTKGTSSEASRGNSLSSGPFKTGGKPASAGPSLQAVSELGHGNAWSHAPLSAASMSLHTERGRVYSLEASPANLAGGFSAGSSPCHRSGKMGFSQQADVSNGTGLSSGHGQRPQSQVPGSQAGSGSYSPDKSMMPQVPAPLPIPCPPMASLPLGDMAKQNTGGSVGGGGLSRIPSAVSLVESDQGSLMASYCRSASGVAYSGASSEDESAPTMKERMQMLEELLRQKAVHDALAPGKITAESLSVFEQLNAEVDKRATLPAYLHGKGKALPGISHGGMGIGLPGLTGGGKGGGGKGGGKGGGSSEEGKGSAGKGKSDAAFPKSPNPPKSPPPAAQPPKASAAEPPKPPAKGKGKGKGPKAPPLAPKAKAKPPQPRKPEVVPRIPLKKLYWSPISIAADSASVNLTVWEKIHQLGINFDVAELETMFADAPTSSTPVGETSLRQLGFKRRQLFSEKRRRQIWFMLALLPERGILPSAIAIMDDSVLEPERVELLCSNLPDNAEDQMLRSAPPLEEHEAWDVPEDFMMMLIAVPDYQLRIRMWGFLNSFTTLYTGLETSLDEVRKACDALHGSSVLEKLLAVTLHVGNHLNGGTPRGRADGFDLEILPKLAKMKGCQKEFEGTLLDFIVKQVEKDAPGELADLFDVDSGDFLAVRNAKRHRLPEVKSEVSALVRQAQEHIQSIAATSPSTTRCDNCLHERKSQLESRLAKLQQLLDGFKDVEKKYTDLCAWFRLESSNLHPTDEFFGIWASFLADVQKALEVEMQKKQKQQRQLKRDSQAGMLKRQSTGAVTTPRRMSRSNTDVSPAHRRSLDNKRIEVPSPRNSFRIPSPRNPSPSPPETALQEQQPPAIKGKSGAPPSTAEDTTPSDPASGNDWSSERTS
jgi:hypothetical protein